MTNRTVQILGDAYGTTTGVANISFNGNVVFNGNVNTINQPLPDGPLDSETVLMTFEIPVETEGTFPMSITCTNMLGLVVGEIEANYYTEPNPIYTPEQIAILTNPATTQSEKVAIWIPLAVPPLTSEEIAALEAGPPGTYQILVDHGLTIQITSGPTNFSSIGTSQYKTNVQVNGISMAPAPPPDGEWWYTVPVINDVGTITFDLTIVKGMA